MVERVAPRSYADLPVSVAVDEGESEQTKVKRGEQMIHDIVHMAGPPPRPAQRIPCPVIIPQRGIRTEASYAPMLPSWTAAV